MATKNKPGVYDCYSRAEPDEPMFVLLGRDPTAAAMVVAWACIHAMRKPDELDKTREALICARDMILWCKKVGKKPVSLKDMDVLAYKVDSLVTDEEIVSIIGEDLIKELMETFGKEEAK